MLKLHILCWEEEWERNGSRVGVIWRSVFLPPSPFPSLSLSPFLLHPHRINFRLSLLSSPFFSPPLLCVKRANHTADLLSPFLSVLALFYLLHPSRHRHSPCSSRFGGEGAAAAAADTRCLFSFSLFNSLSLSLAAFPSFSLFLSISFALSLELKYTALDQA